MSAEPDEPVDLMTDRPHSARAYDYLLGGKTNDEPDRRAGDAAAQAYPAARTGARANRAFMQRVVRFLAGSGVRQFLDVGTGIPTEPNLHQVAQAVAPEARVVYVDNDPIVLAHAAALMTSSPRGSTAYLRADARDPMAIRTSREVQGSFDLRLPTAISLIALLHFLDDGEAAELIAVLTTDLPRGSYLAVSNSTIDFDLERGHKAISEYTAHGIPFHARSRDEVRDLVPSGFELVEPGIVPVHRWRPDSDQWVDLSDAKVAIWGLRARRT